MGPANSTKNPLPLTRTSLAEEIAIEASRLARMAKTNDFPLLAYLIDMAVLEAWREAGESASDPAILDDSQGAQHGG